MSEGLQERMNAACLPFPLQVGGLGLTLTAANRVVIVNHACHLLIWNCML
jgi:hypothetical protein